VTAVQLANIKADLHHYLRKTKIVLSPEFSTVVADLGTFTSAIIRDGFEKALTEILKFSDGLSGRSFIELADIISEHHLRLFQGPEREIVKKSLVEAYIHAAGPQYVFGPTRQTRLLRSLRRWGPRNFVTMFFSLHVFNLVSVGIQDDVRAKMPDVTGFELYMLGVETICRSVVKAAVKTAGTEVDEAWARAVAASIETQFLHVPLNRKESQQSSILSGHKK
jgi:hypothetical protein